MVIKAKSLGDDRGLKSVLKHILDILYNQNNRITPL